MGQLLFTVLVFSFIATSPIVCIFNPGNDFFFFECRRESTPNPAPTTPAPTPVQGDFNIKLINTGQNRRFDGLVELAAQRWEAAIVNDLSNVPSSVFLDGDVFDRRLSNSQPILEDVDDVLIGYEFTDLGVETFAESAPIFVRVTGSTVTGIMQLDYRFFLAQTEETVLALLLHEIGNVLGVGSLWERSNCTTCAEETYRYTCPAASTAYQALPLAVGVGTGSDLGVSLDCQHWAFRSFNDTNWQDVMVPILDPDRDTLLTTPTIASLEDIGDYQVDLSVADPIPNTNNGQQQRRRQRRQRRRTRARRTSGLAGVWGGLRTDRLINWASNPSSRIVPKVLDV